MLTVGLHRSVSRAGWLVDSADSVVARCVISAAVGAVSSSAEAMGLKVSAAAGAATREASANGCC